MKKNLISLTHEEKKLKNVPKYINLVSEHLFQHCNLFRVCDLFSDLLDLIVVSALSISNKVVGTACYTCGGLKPLAFLYSFCPF